MKTFAIFLLSKETFWIRACSILESFFHKLLSKATLSDLRKKTCKKWNIVKVYFKRKKAAKIFTTYVQGSFRKSLSTATFERKHSSAITFTLGGHSLHVSSLRRPSIKENKG